MADPQKVKVFDGTDWVDLKADDPNLPISSSDNKVTLSDDGGTFYIETGSTEAGKSKRVAVASGGQLLVGDTTLENANFNMHVADDDNVQICIDATDVSATTGAVLKLRTGDDKYWNIQHTQNVSGSSEDNQLIINNGSGTAFLRGYQDNSANFGNNVIVQGQIQTDTITTKAAAANDGRINIDAYGVELYNNANNWDVSYRLVNNGLIYSLGCDASEQKVYLPNPDYIEDVDSRPPDYDPATPKSVQQLSQYYYGLGWTSGTTQNAGPGGTTFDYLTGSLITMSRKQNSLITFSEDRTQSVAFAGLVNGTYHEARISVDGNARLTVTDDDIQSFAGYVPQTDQSLVTKGYVAGDGALLPIMAPDGIAELNADNLQNQVAYTNKSDQEITPNENDVFYIRSNGTGFQTSTVAIFNGQSAKPKRGLHVISENGETARTNGKTVLEQRSQDAAGPSGGNPSASIGYFGLNVDGWQHIGMNRGCIILGDEGTGYGTVKTNVSGTLLSSSSFALYIETKIQGVDSTYDPETGTGSFRQTYVVTSTPRIEADIDDLFHFRSYYSSSVQPTKTVKRAEYGFYVDDKLTHSCPKRVGVYSAVAAKNDADRNISVRGAAPSEFVGDVRVNNIREYSGLSNGIQGLFSGASLTLYNQDQDAEYGHFVLNTFNGHMATGIKGNYTPGSATVTFRKHLEDTAANTTVIRCDGPVFGNNGAAITKYGICEYPDNRGDNVSFVAFDAAKYYDASNFPDDPRTEFVDYTGYNVGNWWYNCTGSVAGFKSTISVDPESTKNAITWQIQCSGNAPSYFAGPIQYSSSDLITDDNHLVTKQYVDDGIEQAIQGNQGDTTVEIGTPTSATQPDDAPGSMKIDENFLWVKTNTAWKKLSLAAFDDNATSVTVQLTQSAFNAIASPDPNVLYVIVGD